MFAIQGHPSRSASLGGHRRPCLVVGREVPMRALASASVAVAATLADLAAPAAQPGMAARGVDRRDCSGRGVAGAWSLVSAVARCWNGALAPAPLLGRGSDPRKREAVVFGVGRAPVRPPCGGLRVWPSAGSPALELALGRVWGEARANDGFIAKLSHARSIPGGRPSPRRE